MFGFARAPVFAHSKKLLALLHCCNVVAVLHCLTPPLYCNPCTYAGDYAMGDGHRIVVLSVETLQPIKVMMEPVAQVQTAGV